ncbi:MAG: O-antigen ligase family protein [Actinobacteria bacterium]|nr:O-antigen ligase family protein [Actinomycetota bacterium]
MVGYAGSPKGSPSLRRAGLYLLFGALLLGTLLRGGYFPVPKWTFALLLLLAGAVEVAVVAAFKELSLPRTPLFWLLAAFSAFAAISGAWSAAPGETLRESVLLFGLLAAGYTVLSQLRCRRTETVDLIAAGVVYTTAFASAWGIVSFIIRMQPYSGYVDGFLRAGSTFEYSNALSCFGLMGLPVTFAMLKRSSPRDRPLFGLALGLETAAVLLSYARFGYVILFFLSLYFIVSAAKLRAAVFVSLAAGIAAAVAAAAAEESSLPTFGFFAVIAIFGCASVLQPLLAARAERAARRRARLAEGAAAVAVLIGAPLLILKTGRLRQIVTSRFGQGMEPSHLVPHRLDTYRGVLDAFRIHPLAGFGLGSFAGVYQRYAIASYTKFAHNLVLQTAVDTGIIGAALMSAWLALAVALSIWRLAAARAEPLARAFAISTLVFIAYNMFDWEWYVPALAGWFVVGLMVVATPDRPEKDLGRAS